MQAFPVTCWEWNNDRKRLRGRREALWSNCKRTESNESRFFGSFNQTISDLTQSIVSDHSAKWSEVTELSSRQERAEEMTSSSQRVSFQLRLLILIGSYRTTLHSFKRIRPSQVSCGNCVEGRLKNRTFKTMYKRAFLLRSRGATHTLCAGIVTAWSCLAASWATRGWRTSYGFSTWPPETGPFCPWTIATPLRPRHTTLPTSSMTRWSSSVVSRPAYFSEDRIGTIESRGFTRFFQGRGLPNHVLSRPFSRSTIINMSKIWCHGQVVHGNDVTDHVLTDQTHWSLQNAF